MPPKTMGIAAFSRKTKESEGAVRHLHHLGIVKPERDQWGRRLFGEDDAAAVRRYRAEHRGKRRGAPAAVEASG